MITTQLLRARCILFDNTGAGRSPYTYVEQNVQTLGEDVIGMLDARKVPKAIVVGAQYGRACPVRCKT